MKIIQLLDPRHLDGTGLTTTMIDTQVLNRGGYEVVSPAPARG